MADCEHLCALVLMWRAQVLERFPQEKMYFVSLAQARLSAALINKMVGAAEM